MDKALQKEHSRRFALLHEKYAAKMESLSEREEDCKRISNNIDQLSGEIAYSLRCDMDSLREQIATGPLTLSSTAISPKWKHTCINSWSRLRRRKGGWPLK